MARHKHADLIIAWANGAIIQFSNRSRWIDVANPEWGGNTEYRIKPKDKVKVYQWAYEPRNRQGQSQTTCGHFTKEEFHAAFPRVLNATQIAWTMQEREVD